MNLHGSIKDLQNKIIQRYLKLQHRFSENELIRELWGAMAHDVSQQVTSLSALPQSFWNQLKNEQDLALRAAAEAASHQSIENEEDQSLTDCFNSALCLEEPAILKVYAPLIRKLRENSTAPALDFYIVVKAHLARIARVTQSFAGDPLAIQRANSLLQAFEKEVQEPHIEARILDKKKKATQLRARQEPANEVRKIAAKVRKSAGKARKTAEKARPLAKPAKILHRRPKPMVKKVSISRRRARR
jgi:hypothetical protein